MLSVAAGPRKAESLVDQARAAGADAADAVYVGERSRASRSVWASSRTSIAREGEEIGLRVFVGRRSASIASSDLSHGGAVGTGRAGAGDGRRRRPEDPYAGLAPAELLMPRQPARPRQLDDGGEPDPADAQGTGAGGGRPRRSAVEGVTNSSGGGASASGVDHRARHQPRLFRRLSRNRPQQLGQRRRRRGLGDAARLCLAQRPPRSSELEDA